jgi:Type VI secretion system/phage-baseplate injector OB domain
VSEYFGIYRGKVENNIDPEQRGRIMVSVAGVTGSGTLNWAEPVLPFAGSSVGVWAIPPNQSNVWVAYEGGNSDQPVWLGGFWDQGQAPAQPALAELFVVKTKSCTLKLSDLPGPAGGITLETGAMKISLTPTAIEITNGSASIKLQGPKVSINDTALEVT